MALTPYTAGFGFGGFGDPLLDQMERAMQRSLDRTFGGFGSLVPSSGGTVGRPSDLFRTVAGGTFPMDLVEKEKEYDVIADAPGMKPEDITVEVQDNVLTVRGQHSEVKTDKDQQGRVMRSERVMRSFNRSFVLPEDANPDNVQAQLDKGVLKVVVPKIPAPEKPQPKRITVQGTSDAGTSAATATRTA